MNIGQQIHDKLLVDFGNLEFYNTNTKIFTTVKKFYASGSMHSSNGLIIPDSTPEIVEGQSAGNSQTTRVYTFRAIAVEEIEATDSDSEGSLKYSRLLNIQDAILDYLQKEPSNLNAWGNTNSIFIFKIRVNNVTYDTQKSETGYVALLDVNFSVYLSVIPQNL